MTGSVRKTVIILGVLAAVWLGIRFLLPLVMPFLMGALLALGAEPAVGFGIRKLRLSRPLSAGLGVTLTLILLAGILSLVGALAVKEGHHPGIRTAMVEKDFPLTDMSSVPSAG